MVTLLIMKHTYIVHDYSQNKIRKLFLPSGKMRGLRLTGKNMSCPIGFPRTMTKGNMSKVAA
jgi:hypothetical protein